MKSRYPLVQNKTKQKQKRHFTCGYLSSENLKKRCMLSDRTKICVLPHCWSMLTAIEGMKPGYLILPDVIALSAVEQKLEVSGSLLSSTCLIIYSIPMQYKCAVKWIILNSVDFQCKWASFSPKLINMPTCLGSLYQYLFLCWRNILSMDVYCTQACAETACRLSCSIMGNVFGCVHVHNKCSHTMLCVI